MSNLNLFDYLLLNPNQLLEVEQIPIFSGSLPKFAANPLESLAPSLPLTVSPFSCPPLLSFLLSFSDIPSCLEVCRASKFVPQRGNFGRDA